MNKTPHPHQIRIGRSTWVAESANSREQHHARLTTLLHQLRNDDLYLSGSSANIFLGLDVYNPTLELNFHQRISVQKTRRGGRHMRVNYQTTTPCEVKITTYQLPEEAYCIFADQRILTPAGLVVDHLRHPNAMQAIANAEAVIRGHLHPDAREQAATLQRFTEFIADVRKIATQLASRYRNKVLSRISFLSPWSESVGESITKVALALAGIPPGAQQQAVYIRGHLFRPDFSWRDLRIIIEFDGRAKYGELTTREELLREKEREDLLRLEYPIIIRVNWRNVHDQAFMLALRQHFPLTALSHPRSTL